MQAAPAPRGDARTFSPISSEGALKTTAMSSRDSTRSRPPTSSPSTPVARSQDRRGPPGASVLLKAAETLRPTRDEIIGGQTARLQGVALGLAQPVHLRRPSAALASSAQPGHIGSTICMRSQA